MNDRDDPVDDLKPPSELKRRKSIEIRGPIVGVERLSSRAAIIAVSGAGIMLSLIVYGLSQNKFRIPNPREEDIGAVAVPAQSDPWWQNQPNGIQATLPSPSPNPSDLSLTLPTDAPTSAKIIDVAAYMPTAAVVRAQPLAYGAGTPFPVASFPRIPALAGASATSESTVTDKKIMTDADESPTQKATAAMQAPALVGVGANQSVAEPSTPHPTSEPPGLITAESREPAETLNVTDGKTVAERPYSLLAGTIIPALLITAIDSDSPGTVLAQVTSDVFDSATGRVVLIPRGSKVVGSYVARPDFGANRLEVVWDRLIFPDGSTVSLGQMRGADAAGRSGFDAQVNRHSGELLKGAILMSILGAGAQLSQPPQSEALSTAPSVGQIAAGAVGSQIAEVGTQLTQRELDVAPNLRVPAGYSFTVVVGHDIVFLGPYIGP